MKQPSPHALLAEPLADALAAGITFVPIEGAPEGHQDVEVHQALANKVTTYRLRLDTPFYYPTGGKQPTKAQAALIGPVLCLVSAYSVPADTLAALAAPEAIPTPELPAPPKPPSAFRKALDFPIFTVLAFIFLPFYLLFSLISQTAKKYDGG